MSKYIGQKFGKLTVLASSTARTSGGNYRQIFEVECDCGKKYSTSARVVLKGDSTQCNSCRKTGYAEASAVGYKHPLHKIWWGMLARCHEKGSQSYRYYGARGISVCKRWRGEVVDGDVGEKSGFKNFLEDMGERPSPNHSIDRIDVNGNYEPENCRWVTQKVQANNKQSTVKFDHSGLSLTRSEWSEHLGVPYTCWQAADKYGLTTLEALSILVEKRPLGPKYKWQDIYSIKRKVSIRKNSEKPRRENVLLSIENRERFRKMFN